MGVVKNKKKMPKRVRKLQNSVKLVKSVYRNRKRLGTAAYSVLYLLGSGLKKK